MQSARWLRKEAPADLVPHEAQTITAVFPSSSPNSGPSFVHSFSSVGAVKYAFSMSEVFTSRQFKEIYGSFISLSSDDEIIRGSISSGVKLIPKIETAKGVSNACKNT